MSDLFDKNGYAKETHVVAVYGFDSDTREYLGAYDVRIFEGTGIPGSSTLTIPPAALSGCAVCWDGAGWQQIIDLRGTTAYEKSTGAAVSIKTLGQLDDAYTSKAPATPYDAWDGSAWVTDAEALAAAEIVVAEQRRKSLLATANAEISWRQDAVDVGDATAEETADLTAWKKYRVLLMRVDTSATPDIVWPTQPGE